MNNIIICVASNNKNCFGVFRYESEEDTVEAFKIFEEDKDELRYIPLGITNEEGLKQFKEKENLVRKPSMYDTGINI